MHVMSMGKMVQIRNMPEAIHRRAKARAAEAGMSLSEYLLREIQKSVEQPTNKEIMERLAKLPPLSVKTPPAEMIRQGREERDRDLERLDRRIRRSR